MRQSTLCFMVLICGVGPSNCMLASETSSQLRLVERSPGDSGNFWCERRRSCPHRRTRAECGPYFDETSARRRTEPDMPHILHVTPSSYLFASRIAFWVLAK